MPKTPPNKAISYTALMERLEYILLKLAEIKEKPELNPAVVPLTKIDRINLTDPLLRSSFKTAFFINYPLSEDAQRNQEYQDIFFESFAKYIEFRKQVNPARFLQSIYPTEGHFSSGLLEKTNFLAHRIYHSFNDHEVKELIDHKKAHLDPHTPDHQAQTTKLEIDLKNLKHGQLVLMKGKSGLFDHYVSAQEIKETQKNHEPLEDCWYEGDFYESYTPEPTETEQSQHVALTRENLDQYLNQSTEFQVEGKSISVENLLRQAEASEGKMVDFKVQLNEETELDVKLNTSTLSSSTPTDVGDRGSIAKIPAELAPGLAEPVKPASALETLRTTPSAVPSTESAVTAEIPAEVSTQITDLVAEAPSEAQSVIPAEAGIYHLEAAPMPTEVKPTLPPSAMPRHSEQPFTPPETGEPLREQPKDNAAEAERNLQDTPEAERSVAQDQENVRKKREESAKATDSDPEQTHPTSSQQKAAAAGKQSQPSFFQKHAGKLAFGGSIAGALGISQIS